MRSYWKQLRECLNKHPLSFKVMAKRLGLPEAFLVELSQQAIEPPSDELNLVLSRALCMTSDQKDDFLGSGRVERLFYHLLMDSKEEWYADDPAPKSVQIPCYHSIEDAFYNEYQLLTVSSHKDLTVHRKVDLPLMPLDPVFGIRSPYDVVQLGIHKGDTLVINQTIDGLDSVVVGMTNKGPCIVRRLEYDQKIYFYGFDGEPLISGKDFRPYMTILGQLMAVVENI